MPNNVYTRRDIVRIVVTWLLRLAVGAVFIFSGVVKAVDPWGTVFKMQDYLAAMPGTWPMTLASAAVVATFLLCIVEVVIGVALLLGCYRRAAPLAGLVMMAFMLPLTLWIAISSPVTDCGCFGDALVIGNWTTFWKNVVITGLCLWLFKYGRTVRTLILPTLQWLMIVGVSAYVLVIALIGYNAQPLIDFRPYPIGSTLIDDSEQDTDILARWSDGKNVITIPADSIPEGDNWQFQGRVEPQKKAAAEKGLAIYEGDEEITSDLIEPEEEQVLVFMYDLPGVSTSRFYKLNSLYAYCQEHEIPMSAVVAASDLQIEDFRDRSLAEYPIYTAEDTALKEVVRGNPAVIYLRDGKIIWKNSLKDIETDDFMYPDAEHAGSLQSYTEDKGDTFMFFTLILAGYLAVLIMLSHVPMAIRLITHHRKGAPIAISTLFIMATLTSCSDSKDEPSPLPQQPTPVRTILVYMVANNNLQGNADADLEEMLQGYKAALSHEEGIYTQFVIYLASPRIEIPTLYKIGLDKKGEPELQVLKKYETDANSVSPQRITQVISDMKSLAPAPEYDLMLWSHASGWLPATANSPSKVPPMYSYGNDYGKSIGIVELAQTLPRDTFHFIWMDCCFMGGIEEAYQLRHNCEKYVAYPTEILAEGAPYQLLVPIFSRKDLDLKDAVYALYSYFAGSAQYTYRSCTVAITETDKLDTLATASRKIVETGNTNINVGGLQIYGYLQGVFFYDFAQTYQSIAGTNDTSAFQSALDAAVTYKLCTDHFLNFKIDPTYFSGLNCHPVNAAAQPAMQEYYKTLDWYKAVYLPQTQQ